MAVPPILPVYKTQKYQNSELHLLLLGVSHENTDLSLQAANHKIWTAVFLVFFSIVIVCFFFTIYIGTTYLQAHIQVSNFHRNIKIN